DARVLDREVHLLDRAVEGVDRNDADRQALTPLGRVKAAAGLDRELHPEGRLGLERRDRRLRVDDLDLAGGDDVGRGRDARAFLLDRERDRLVGERAETDLLQ